VLGAFGVLWLPGRPVQLIARVDDVDPDTDVPVNRQTRVIGGVAWQVSPSLRVLANVDHASYEGGSPSAAAAAARTQGLLQAQVTF
jgi:hypothetical protein